MDSIRIENSAKPRGKFIKTFTGAKSGHVIDVYYDETVGGYIFYSDPNGIYEEIYNTATLSLNLIEDCEDSLLDIILDFNDTEQSIYNGCQEALEYAKEDNNESK